jgi:hypothetical protein
MAKTKVDEFNPLNIHEENLIGFYVTAIQLLLRTQIPVAESQVDDFEEAEGLWSQKVGKRIRPFRFSQEEIVNGMEDPFANGLGDKKEISYILPTVMDFGQHVLVHHFNWNSHFRERV